MAWISKFNAYLITRSVKEWSQSNFQLSNSIELQSFDFFEFGNQAYSNSFLGSRLEARFLPLSHVWSTLVQFALVRFKIWFCLALPETGVALLQGDYCTHQFARVIFSWDWCLRLSFSLLTLFVIWHSGTTRFKYRFSHIKSVDYFMCCICHYGLHQAFFHQLKVFG